MLFFIGMSALFYLSGKWDILRNNIERQFTLMPPHQQQELITNLAAVVCVGIAIITCSIFYSIIPSEVRFVVLPTSIIAAWLLSTKLASRIR